MSNTLAALFKLAGGIYGGDAVERLIVAVTGGHECHVEAVISDDPWAFFSAQLKTGVRILNHLDSNIERWYGLDTGLEVTSEAMEWALSECGQPYNLLEAIISGFKCAKTHNLEPLFCSQAFAQFYKRCGGNLGLEKPNPHDLAKRLIELGAKPIELLPSDLFSTFPLEQGVTQ